MLVCVLAFLIGSKSAQAQCPTISSNLGCQVDGTVDIFSYATPPSGPCSSMVCNSFPFTLQPNGVLNLNCGGCLPVCNVVVIITDLNGLPITSTSVDFSTGSPLSLGVGTTPCTSTGATFVIYDASSNTFKIYQ